jgi:manganese transport protein
VLAPRQIDVSDLYQAALPTTHVLGPWALIVVIIGFFACTFGAALETMLSCGYMVAQFFGWQWGKATAPREAARFHVVVLVGVVIATGVVLTSFDPVRITEFVVVLSAAALPLTYFPVLVVANDPEYMGEKVNGRVTNALGFAFLVLIVVVSVATLPLMILTKAGG